MQRLTESGLYVHGKAALPMNVASSILTNSKLRNSINKQIENFKLKIVDRVEEFANPQKRKVGDIPAVYMAQFEVYCTA